MIRSKRANVILAAASATAAVLLINNGARAVDPSPLENAYWKFEEGTAGQPVDASNPNAVIDSINANHMRTANTGTAPMYSSIVSTLIVPQTGLPNNLSLQFTGARDVYSDTKDDNYPTASSVFTLEASFKLDNIVLPGPYQCIVGKDGQPNASSPIATLELKVRGDSGKLQIEQMDGSSTSHQVTSAGALAAGQWYHTAVVNDGSTLSLWLDSGDGQGYVLQGQTFVNGAFPDVASSWAIGRGMYNNTPADWIDGGEVEEVRLSNTALDPSKFLFTPATARWNVNAGGAWSSSSNWQDGIPRVPGATANLTDAIQASRTLVVDESVSLGTLNFDNANGYVITGAQAITIDTPAGSAATGAINVQNGSHLIAAPMQIARDTTVFINGSADLLKLTGNLTVSPGVTITKQGLGTWEAKNLRASTVNIAGGNIHITPSGGVAAGVSRIGQLSITGVGAFDLGDNKLITSMPVGQLSGLNYDGVTGLIQSGRNGGGWSGSGIVTSQSNATGGNYHSIGVAQASDVLPATATATALWAGQTISGADTLVMYSYGGDANLDGKINVDDYIRIDSGIAAGLTGWSNGDFNYDGKINIDDYTGFIDANIGIQQGVFPTAAGWAAGEATVVAVPEPGLLGWGASAICLSILSCRSRAKRRVGSELP